MKFLNDRVPSCPILEIWDLAGLGSGPLAQVTIDSELIIILAKTFQMSTHLFNLNHRNSSYACKSVFFLVRVLVKARFLDS
jgi:hypothetical protein